MIGFPQYLKIISLATWLFVTGGYFSLSFTEEEQVEVSDSKESKEECLQNFDINNVDFEMTEVIKDIPLLAQYFQCRAIVRDDIKECDNLNPWPDQVSACRLYFNYYHGFYGRLLMAGQATPQILNVCINALKLNIEECRLYASGWLADDISMCESLDKTRSLGECRANISGDPKFCRGSDICIKQATYFKAIKTQDIKKCDGIRDNMVKIMCRGYISMDEKICEDNRGFEEFRNNYCR